LKVMIDPNVPASVRVRAADSVLSGNQIIRSRILPRRAPA
jgi:hypothetical protein